MKGASADPHVQLSERPRLPDLRSPLQEVEDVSVLQNFRMPRLNLECVYGAGPVGQPYLYDVHDPDKLIVGRNGSETGDLPRNEQGLAIIGEVSANPCRRITAAP